MEEIMRTLQDQDLHHLHIAPLLLISRNALLQTSPSHFSVKMPHPEENNSTYIHELIFLANNKSLKI